MIARAERIVLVDYGMGNLRSVERAFARIGTDVRVSDRPEDVRGADRVVLPGVDSAQNCMKALRSKGPDDAVARTSHGAALLNLAWAAGAARRGG